MSGCTAARGEARSALGAGAVFSGMALCIWLSFGWAFYVPDGLYLFIGSLFFLGFFGGNFAMYSLWLPEQYPTAIRATAFAFVTSFGRFVGAGVNFLIGAGVHSYGSVGMPVAATAIAFILGVFLLPLCLETRGGAVAGVTDRRVLRTEWRGPRPLAEWLVTYLGAIRSIERDGPVANTAGGAYYCL